MLQALAQHADGDRAGALDTLERALALAEPEGYVRVFVDEGEPMAALLGALAARRPDVGLPRDLVLAAQRPGRTRPRHRPRPPPRRPRASSTR